MILKQEEKLYKWSYQELKEHYLRFVNMTDDDFKGSIIEALHLACAISYLKEISTDVLLCDVGLIHEMVHLISEGTSFDVDIEEVRKKFDLLLLLA